MNVNKYFSNVRACSMNMLFEFSVRVSIIEVLVCVKYVNLHVQ